MRLSVIYGTVFSLLCFCSFPLSGREKGWTAFTLPHRIETKIEVYALPGTATVRAGMDSGLGRALASYNGKLFVATDYSIIRIMPGTNSGARLLLPGDTRGGVIASLAVSHRNIWCGLSNGLVARYSMTGRRWYLYDLKTDETVNVMILRKTAVAVTAVPGGGGYIFRYRTPQSSGEEGFFSWFSLPEVMQVKPWRFFDTGKRFWMGSDTGLFSINPENLSEWVMAGARDHLTKTVVHDAVPVKDGLLLAASKAQYAKVPANVKFASWGRVYFNYIQNRWERPGLSRDPALDRFIRLNSRNTNLPPGGIWFYQPATDRAFRLPGADDDMGSLYSPVTDLWLAAGSNGLYRIDKLKKEWKISPVIRFSSRWITGLTGVASRTALLTGSSVILISNTHWRSSAGVKKQNGSGRQVVRGEEAVYIRQLQDYLKNR